MNKTRAVPLACTLLLALALGATTAVAQSQTPPTDSVKPPAPAVPAAEPALCLLPAPAADVEPAPFLSLDVPEPTERVICRFRCSTTRCSSDNQCTAAPGGVCVPVCSSGCCSYP
jgi:hypothetical protein